MVWEEFGGKDQSEDDDHYYHMLDAISNQFRTRDIHPVFLTADENSQKNRYKELVSKIQPGNSFTASVGTASKVNNP